MPKSIGDRIRDLRDRRGFKQQELADKIGVSRQVLSNWERGYTPVDTEGVLSLVKHLETSVDYIMYGRFMSDDTISPVEKIALALQDDEELLTFFNELSIRDDLRLLFKQTKDLKPKTIKRIIKYIKLVEDEEALND